MKKLNRNASFGLIIVFALFLSAAVFLTWRARWKTYSFYENRSLAPNPVFTVESAADGSYCAALESYLLDRAAGHNTLAQIDTRIDLMLRRPVVNDVVVRDDILLPWLRYEAVSPDTVAAGAGQMAQRLSSVSRLVSSYGGRYCYAAVPCQYAYHADRYPAFLNNRSELTRLSLEALTPALSRAGVDFLDLGETFDTLGHPDEFSSAVDNHFSIRGAYEACRAILAHFNAEGAGLYVPSWEDFTVSQLDKPYLGSRMRKLLGAWPSDERLSYLLPRKEIPFTRSDNGHDSAPTVYAFPAETDEWVTYSFYMGGDVGSTVLDTHRPDLPSILVYGDSFTNAVECLIYLSFNQMHSLDFRYYSGGMTLGEYIEAFRPDYVVCIRDYEALLSPDFNGTGVN